jgi:hypothetical protein
MMQGFPFQSLNGDRKYGITFWNRWFGKLVSNGVFMDIPTSFQVVAKSGMTCTLKTGNAMVGGVFEFTEADEDIIFDVASGTARDDLVVLQADYVNREPKYAIKKNAQKENGLYILQRDSSLFEMAVAAIHLQANSSEITQAMIEDLRLNSNYCGPVVAMVDHIDTTALYAQIQDDLATYKSNEQAAFSAWFATIQDIFDSNAELNLLSLINACLKLDGSVAMLGNLDMGNNNKTIYRDAAGILKAEIVPTATGVKVDVFDAAGLNPKTFEIKNDGNLLFNGKKVWTEDNLYSGVGEPAGGKDGDIYFQIIE